MAAQREWFEKDYYKTLGVAEGANAKEITKAYRKLARTYHPDANRDDPKAEDRFKEISAAYDVLGDEARRKEYDEVRRLGTMGGFGPGGADPGGFSFNVGDADVGDLLGGLFGRGRGGRGRGASGVAPQRGHDLEAELTLDFEDAVHGLTTTLYLTSDAVCSTCEGSGAKPGTEPKVCRVCNGRGVVDDNQGFFSFSKPCTNCQGRGVVIEDPCPTCRGTGIERRPREVKVRLPAGVSDGQRIALEGAGRARSQRRAAGRPVRHLPCGAAPAVRARGRQPHRARPGHVLRGRSRGRHPGPDARGGDGDAAAQAGYAVGRQAPGEGAGRGDEEEDRRPHRDHGRHRSDAALGR